MNSRAVSLEIGLKQQGNQHSKIDITFPNLSSVVNDFPFSFFLRLAFLSSFVILNLLGTENNQGKKETEKSTYLILIGSVLVFSLFLLSFLCLIVFYFFFFCQFLYWYFSSFSVFFSCFLSSSVLTFHVASSCFPLYIFLSLFLLFCCFMFFFDAVTSSFLQFLSFLQANWLFVLSLLAIQLSIFFIFLLWRCRFFFSPSSVFSSTFLSVFSFFFVGSSTVFSFPFLYLYFSLFFLFHFFCFSLRIYLTLVRTNPIIQAVGSSGHQIEFYTLRHQIEVFNMTTPHGLWYHHYSRQILVALCLKFPLDHHCNLMVGKSDENTKHRLGSLIQKFIRY